MPLIMFNPPLLIWVRNVQIRLNVVLDYCPWEIQLIGFREKA
jgi:hypothetical protein